MDESSVRRGRLVGVFLWVGALGALLLVLAGSLVPGHIKWVPFPLPDQQHFWAYLLMGCLFALALRGGWKVMLAVALGLTLIGFGIELLQSVVPNRSFRWIDVASNAAGATAGVLIAVFIMWVVAHVFRSEH